MTLDMDFIDHACMTTEEGFAPLMGTTSSPSSHQQHHKKSKDAVIESLRKELSKSKMREKKLIQEFTDKIKELHQVSPIALELVSASSKSNTTTTTTKTTFLDGEDMPMDEMADTARMERTVRTLEQMEQKRIMEEFQKKMDKEMMELQRSHAQQLQNMEFKLKENEEENDVLKKKVETVEIERNYYRQQMTEKTWEEEQIICNSSRGRGEGMIRNDLTPLQRLRWDRLKRGDYTPQTCDTNTTFDSISAETGAAVNGGASPGPTSRLDALFETMTDPSLNSMYELLKVVEKVVSSEDGEEGNNDKSGEQALLETLSDGKREFVIRIKEIFDHSHREHIQVIESLKTELEETYDALKEDDLEVTTMLEEKQNKIRELELELSSARESARNHSVLENMLRMVAEEQKSSLVQFQELKKKMKVVEKERDELIVDKERYVEEQDHAKVVLCRIVSVADADGDKYGLKDLLTKVEKLSREHLFRKRQLDPSHDPSMMDDKSEVIIDKDGYNSLCRAVQQLEELERQMKVEKGIKEQMHMLETELHTAQQTIQELKDEVATNEQFKIDYNDISTENMALKIKVTELENLTEEFHKLKIEHGKFQSEIEHLRNALQQSQTDNETLLADLESKKGLQEQVSLLEIEVDNLRKQTKEADEAIQTAKEAHKREEKLEKELSNAMSLLDKITAEKEIVETNLRSQSQSMMAECNELESKLQELQDEVIEMKEERLAFKSKVRETEIELERTRRILSLLQETSDVEGTASQAILDLKEQLQEEQESLSRLRYCCEPGSSFIIDDIEAKVHLTLCLLETNVLSVNGSTSITPFDFSSSATPKEQLLERSLRVQRAENDRIQKEMEDFKIEKDQETSILQVELMSLQGKYDLKNEMLTKKEQELKTILKEPCVGYISEDESDFEDIDPELITKSFNKNNNNNNNNINGTNGMCKTCEKLQVAKEAAENEAKEKAQSLTEAKMIISSLEQSNKNITENLRSRLHDSNAAIVSLLEQSKLHEKETAEFRKQLKRYEVQKESLKATLTKPRDKHIEAVNGSTISAGSETSTTDDEAIDKNLQAES